MLGVTIFRPSLHISNLKSVKAPSLIRGGQIHQKELKAGASKTRVPSLVLLKMPEKCRKYFISGDSSEVELLESSGEMQV